MYRKSKSNELKPHMVTESTLMPKKKQKKVIFDRDILTYECHHAMLAGLCLISKNLCPKIKNDNKKLNILVLGTGTGILPMFLSRHFGSYVEKITTVEIDSGVLIAGRDYFGFQTESEPLIESLCADAFDWVMSNDSANGLFDLILVDINYEEDGESKISPPIKFFSAEFISKLAIIANNESSLIAFNVVVSDDESRKKVV